MRLPQLLSLAIILMIGACKNTETKETSTGTDTTAIVKDLHTQSNADSVTVKHLDLDIKVDFDSRQIGGSATWTIANPNKSAVLKLDTYDLTIDSISVDGQKVEYSLGQAVEHLG